MSSSTATATAAVLKDYAPAAASLFNNMKTPASILAGAIVPLGFLSPLPEPPENIKSSISTTKTKSKTGKGDPKSSNLAIFKRLDRMLRKSYLLVTIFSFGSELLAVMWATVAVNQLTETVVEPSESVWALLKRDWFDLAWAATNSHFVLGKRHIYFSFNVVQFEKANACASSSCWWWLSAILVDRRNARLYVDGRDSRLSHRSIQALECQCSYS